MSRMVKLLKSYAGKSLRDEDGDPLSLRVSPGTSASRLQEFERFHHVQLPGDLKDLLLFSNGIDLFGAGVSSLEKMELFPDELLLTFHAWGNGDLDVISLDPEPGYGTIYFLDHSVEDRIPLDLSFFDWVFLALKEIEEKGTLLHPMDYGLRDTDGLYKNVFLKLKDKWDAG